MKATAAPGVFYVRTIRAHRGARFVQQGADIRFSSKLSAVEAAEQLQLDFDESADPARVYVLDKDGIPIVAAGARKISALQSLLHTNA